MQLKVFYKLLLSRSFMGLWLGIAPLSSFVWVSAKAATLKSTCYLQDVSGQKITGINFNEKHEIASVSKVMTTYWSLKELGPKYRFKTKVHITPKRQGLVDVHIEGGSDPFFGREQMQFLFLELARVGVSRINQFSFDENFVFFPEPRSSAAAQGHFSVDQPSLRSREQFVRQVLANLSQGFDQTRSRARAIENMELPQRTRIPISSIGVRLRAEHSKTESTVSYTMSSVELYRILKEMNRNSNNHVSNRIFESLGGADEFKVFINKELGLSDRDIEFYNGSGDRVDLANGGKAYNEATCAAILKTIVALKEFLQSKDMNLGNVLAVAGVDASEERSTTSALYSGEATNGALIAKTGTVNPSVTLAGLAHTEEGDVYFGFISSTKGTAADWRAGRALIRNATIEMMSDYGGASPKSYSYKRFLSFDRQSAFVQESNGLAKP